MSKDNASRGKRVRANNQWVAAKTSAIHGQGLFARKDIPPGLDFVEYDGLRLPATQGKKMAEEGNVYVFQLNRREFIDGSVAWNLARYANHACQPNAQSVSVGGRIWLRARRLIRAREEITYNYGYSFRDEPVRCTCGCVGCVGVIVSSKAC